MSILETPVLVVITVSIKYFQKVVSSKKFDNLVYFYSNG